MPHVFLSYLREDKAIVDRLVQELRSKGIAVWLDREKIMPGQRWKAAIRAAIEDGSYFVACFSIALEKRERSYFHEELSLAIDELCKRPADRSWFIPVLLESCEVPPRSIGGGETLRDIQWINLSENWSEGVDRLARALKQTTSLSEAKPLLRQEPPDSDSDYRVRARAMGLPQQLINVPEVALKTLIEKPPAWEMLLVGQLLSHRIESAQSKEDLLFTPATFEAPTLEIREVIPYIRKEIAPITRMMEHARRLAIVLTEAIGQAGENADPIKVHAFTERFGELYSAALKWQLKIRDVRVPEIFGDIMLQFSGVSQSITDAIEEFRDQAIRNYEKYSQLSAEEKAGEYTLRVHVVIGAKEIDTFAQRMDALLLKLDDYASLP